ncbi:phage tail protein [Pseudomonas prosekii]|uniref:phage tail protein n=1 Tax=Pseudomonas prosekii TaxID=1148509 RepID=UPI00215AA6CB|nr:phage tail protein [Pseudomonas prosekii]
MIDANSQFFAILTNVGMAKQANADALGIPWKITEMGVGDANGTDPIPSAVQTRLINEWRRRPLNQLKIDPANPAVIIAEQVIPADEGGKWIREIALYDADGDMVAVANCAPSYKPVLSQGSGRTQVVRMNFIVSSSGNITLKIDPAVVLATRKYVDDSIINVLPPDKTPGTFTRVTINSRGVVTNGSNPTTLEGYGITDAMAKGQGGLGTTAPPVNDIGGSPVTTFFTSRPETVGKPPQDYTAGLHIKYPDSNYCIDIAGGITAEALFFRRLDGEGNGAWRTIYHSGNFEPGNKADKATTLGGYGIPIATLEDAETGTNNTKPMTVLRVWQAIAKAVVQAGETTFGVAKIATQTQANSGQDDTTFVTPAKLSGALAALIVQATEAIAGIAKVATQALTDAGVNDTTFVTPKKMRWGFQILKANSGYLVFPTWLGSFVIQWGSTPVAYGEDMPVTFVIPFPTNCLIFGALPDYTQGSGSLGSWGGTVSSRYQGVVRCSASGLGGKYIAFGY